MSSEHSNREPLEPALEAERDLNSAEAKSGQALCTSTGKVSDSSAFSSILCSYHTWYLLALLSYHPTFQASHTIFPEVPP